MAKSVCRRGTCTKVEIGAVIIRNDQVISTGYCGAPRGTKSSQEHGFCLRRQLGIPSGHNYEICRSVHAEQNAIINAARAGTSLLGGDMYIYGKIYGSDEALDAFPCFICKKMIINCGLKRVICSLKDGGHKVFNVSEWVKEWQENDIIDDKFQYGVESKEGKPAIRKNPLTISPKLAAKAGLITTENPLVYNNFTLEQTVNASIWSGSGKEWITITDSPISNYDPSEFGSNESTKMIKKGKPIHKKALAKRK